MPVTITHALSATTPDDPGYEIRPTHWNSEHAVTLSIAASEISGLFSNANGVSFGSSNGSITASIAAGAAPGSISAGTTNYALGEVIFSNANGVSFGLNGQTVTATVQTNYLTTAMASNRGSDFVQATAAFNGTNASGTIASNAISVSVLAQTNQTIGAYATGNTTQSSSGTIDARSLTFQATGGISAGVSNGSVVLSVQPASNLTVSGFLSLSTNGNTMTIGAGPLSFYATSNTTQSSSGTIDGRSITFAGAGGASIGISNGSIVVSGGAGAAVVVSNAIQSVGSATGSGTNTSRFAADDHVHAGVFSMGVSTGGNTVGDTRVDVGRFVFQGGNNVTLSQITAANALNTIVISGGAGGAETQTAISGIGVSDTTYTSGTVIWSAQANVTLNSSVNGASQYVRVSVGAQSNQSGGIYALGNTTGQSSSSTFDARTLSVEGAGIVSVGWSNSSLRISATQSNQAVSNSAGSFTFQTLNFSNANNVTWGTSAGGIVTASVAAPGAAAESNHHHALGANTAGNTTASGSTIGLSGINLTISGTNDSVLNLSVPPTSSLTGINNISISTNGSTISVLNRWNSYFPILGVGYVQGTTAISTPGASTNLVQPFFLPQPMSLSYVRIPMSVGKASTTGGTTAARSWSFAEQNTYFVNFYSLGTGASSRSLQYVTGSSVGITFSNIYNIGAASNNQSFSYSASIPTEGTTTQYTTSGTVNSANFVFNTTVLSNSFVGNKWLDVPMGVSLSAGAWWIAIQRSSTTGSTTAGGNFAGLTNITSRASFYAASQVNVPVLPWGVNTSASTGAAWQVGLGAWTTNTNGSTTSSMALSDIVSVANQPVFPINLVRQA